MQNPSRETPISRHLTKEEPSSSRKPKEEKITSVGTPRRYLQKTTPSDIYGKKNVLQAPKKTSNTNLSSRNVSPMKDLLKSSSSSVSQVSARNKMAADRKNDTKPAQKSKPVKAKAPSNVTVNSPVVRKKLNLTKERSNSSIDRGDATEIKKLVGKTNMADVFTRQRSKTRTLDENEVKVLKHNVVDNNEEMKNLARKLSAKPKSFYVELDEAKKKKKIKKEPIQPEKDISSEEEFNYEDDYESYESDFDSYHSEEHSGESKSGRSTDYDVNSDDGMETATDTVVKDGKDEEKMLDSGSYDLRETQRSAQRSKPVVMDFILEGGEEAEKKSSMTDEGIQDMSTSSAVSIHVDVLDRPLFVDFSSSKRSKKKRLIFDRLRRRAEDILSMVTLHEMKYTLFEMEPVPYDVYMASFGRRNCTQVSVQTFEDGISTEVQTDRCVSHAKWTQHPVKFSKHDICLNKVKILSEVNEDLASKFTVLLNPPKNAEDITGFSYENDPLKILLEQKDGVGSDSVQRTQETKMYNIDCNVKRLKKFLNRAERRISRILSMNSGNTDVNDSRSKSNIPFSDGYLKVPIEDVNFAFMKDRKVTNAISSENRSNFVVTVHEGISSGKIGNKCVLCVWDMGLVIRKPVKFLIATDKVVVVRYRGGSDGIVAAALIDGTIHLWDLSDQATWSPNDTFAGKPTNSVEIDSISLTQTELDRKWNRVHGDNNFNKEDVCLMQSSAYTSSGVNIMKREECDRITGLEFLGDPQMTSQDCGTKIVAQLCSLQRSGTLTLWSIIRDKRKRTKDIGRAFWSKISLEILQRLDMTENLEFSRKINTLLAKDIADSFDLDAAKRRLSSKVPAKIPLTSNDSSSSVARPRSARKRVLPLSEGSQNCWETGLVCFDLKVVRVDGADKFLIARNCGEVLACTRYAGVFKISRCLVTNDSSSISCLQVFRNDLPYFVAATDTGVVSLCSLQDMRVLLTLDCRNTVQTSSEKFNLDPKGRYMGSIHNHKHTYPNDENTGALSVASIVWSSTNPFEVGALLGNGALVHWRLTSSDIVGKKVDSVATLLNSTADVLILITAQNVVQVHRLKSEECDNMELFKKYTSLL